MTVRKRLSVCNSLRLTGMTVRKWLSVCLTCMTVRKWLSLCNTLCLTGMTVRKCSLCNGLCLLSVPKSYLLCWLIHWDHSGWKHSKSKNKKQKQKTPTFFSLTIQNTDSYFIPAGRTWFSQPQDFFLTSFIVSLFKITICHLKKRSASEICMLFVLSAYKSVYLFICVWS